MSEEQLTKAAFDLKKAYKIAFLEQNITQKEVAKQLHTTSQQLGRAIRGDMTPRSHELREQMAEILHMKKEDK